MKKSPILLFCTIICCTLANSQSLVEKSFFTKNRTIGGDVLITKSVQEVKEQKAFTSFEVDIPSAGNYYVNFWLCPAKSPNGVFYEYDVLVNERTIGKIVPSHGDWQSISINDLKNIELPAGKCTVSVVGTIPDIPSVEFVRLSKDSLSAQICSMAYDNYKNEIKRINNTRLSKMASTNSQFIDTIVGTKDIFPLPPQTNPPYDAQFVIGASVHYTFYKRVYLQAGTTFFSTEGINNFSHVLEVFSASSPASYTWRKMSDSQYKAYLNITIASSGYYYVRVRSYYNTASGLCNLNINNQFVYEEIPVYSYGIRGEKDTNHIYNSFTCYSNGDPRLWVEEESFPGFITAYNDDYSDCSDFDWEYDARILRQYANSANAIHLTSASSYEPVFSCDIYMNCISSSINTSSTNFIQSAPSTSTYNCISWSGGIYSAFIWPPYAFSSTISDPLCAFDYFYNTERYPGCSLFTRSGATASNCTVELWANPNDPNYYTHASVRKGADNNAHGFDWESKCGHNIRVYHPEGKLISSYGQVVEYYRRIGNNSSGIVSLEEAIANGDAVMENVQFTPDEINFLETRILALEENIRNRFEILFDNWSQVWDNTIYSNPDQIADCNEYQELLSFCKTNSDLNYFVYKKLGEGFVCATCLVKDLTLEQNRDLLQRILEEKEKRKMTEDGKTIFYTILSNSMSYVRELLADRMQDNQKTRNTKRSFGISYSNTDLFDICVKNRSLDISFHLHDISRVYLDIMDLQGKVVAEIVNQPTMDVKLYKYQCSLPKGIYLVRYILNGNLNVKKACVE